METCSICGSTLDESRPAVRVEGYQFVRCPKCRHLWREGKAAPTFSLPSEVKMLRNRLIYRLLRFYDWMRIRRYRDIIQQHEEPYVLDVGAGPQFSAATLKQMGVGYVGVEPNPEWLEHVESSGAEIIQGTLADVPDEVFERVNIVLLFHVVEHLPKPLEQLTQLANRCREGTSLILRTPDGNGLGLQLWGRNWYPLCPDEHPTIYTRTSLLLALIRTGRVDVERIENGDFLGETALSMQLAIRRIVRSNFVTQGLMVLLSPLVFTADFLTGLAARFTRRTHEFEAVCKVADSPVFLSFVIPAYNESARIGGTIEAMQRTIAACGLPEGAAEIIVVNNNSTDDTQAIAEAKGAQVVFLADRHIAMARNTGGRNARGKYIVFVDADCVVDESFCPELLRGLARHWPDTAGVATRINADGGASAAVVGTLTMRMFRWLGGSSFSIFIMRREVFEKYGGFDEHVFAYEDVHWLIKFKLRGYLGRLKRYRIFSRVTASVSSRAARRGGAMLTYLLHAFIPWLRYSKKSCEYWYAERQSD